MIRVSVTHRAAMLVKWELTLPGELVITRLAEIL